MLQGVNGGLPEVNARWDVRQEIDEARTGSWANFAIFRIWN
ncbi:MAG TPA: hypothetical protein VE035_02715 [Puia sp.]|nr:hypothetical protein [Puia sp.]